MVNQMLFHRAKEEEVVVEDEDDDNVFLLPPSALFVFCAESICLDYNH
jgi:hypothetical protein